MKLKNGRVTILISERGMEIHLECADSGIRFAEAHLTQEQTCQVLGRLARTHANIQVMGLDKVGKKLEIAQHEFDVSDLVTSYSGRDYEAIHARAIATAPKGWEPDNYYQSQKSIFERDGKKWARTNIRRWVDQE